MPDDREIIRQTLDREARARDFRLLDLPGYMAWSTRKLAEGESPAYIANLDATSTWCLPEDAEKMADSDYDEMLQDLKEMLSRSEDDPQSSAGLSPRRVSYK